MMGYAINIDVLLEGLLFRSLQFRTTNRATNQLQVLRWRISARGAFLSVSLPYMRLCIRRIPQSLPFVPSIPPIEIDLRIS